eukprot:scaffold967_cov321-Pavlova_lutheri.AAC.30
MCRAERSWLFGERSMDGASPPIGACRVPKECSQSNQAHHDAIAGRSSASNGSKGRTHRIPLFHL